MPGKGISLLELDEAKGSLREIHSFTGVKNPSYLCFDRREKLLLAATENDENRGAVTSFRLSGNRALSRLSFIDGPGRANCHVNMDSTCRLVFAASYGEGRLKVYSLEGGRLIENILDHNYEGKGPNEERQEHSHAHQAVLSPDERWLYVADLGSDCLWIHDMDDLSAPPRSVKTPPGKGPRHMVFHRESQRLYVVCELIPALLVFDWDSRTGNLSLIQDAATVEDGDNPKAQPSAVKIHPSGKTVTLANRFTDTVTVFDINGESGLVENRLIFPGRGLICRDLEFSPSGKWLLMAYQESCDIQLCPFDQETGRPVVGWGEAFETGTPTCLVPLD